MSFSGRLASGAPSTLSHTFWRDTMPLLGAAALAILLQALWGILLVGSLAGDSLAKGIFSGALGALIACWVTSSRCTASRWGRWFWA
jgi:hypothetical protein